MAAAFALLSAAYAQEGTDTLVVRNPEEVVLITSPDYSSLSIKGSADDPDYTYYREVETGESSRIYESENVAKLDFSLPFSYPTKEDESLDYQNKASFLFGFFKVYNGLMVSPASNPYNLNYGHLGDFGFSVLKYDGRMIGGFSFNPSLGFGWRSYLAEEGLIYQKSETGGIAAASIPGGMDLKYSKATVFSVQAPLMFDFYSRKDKIGVQFGPIVNVNVSSRIKNVYKMDGGKKQKDKLKNIHHVPFSVDYMAMLRFKWLGFYVKYSPQSLLDTRYSPGMRNSVTVGIFIN